MAKFIKTEWDKLEITEVGSGTSHFWVNPSTGERFTHLNDAAESIINEYLAASGESNPEEIECEWELIEG